MGAPVKVQMAATGEREEFNNYYHYYAFDFVDTEPSKFFGTEKDLSINSNRFNRVFNRTQVNNNIGIPPSLFGNTLASIRLAPSIYRELKQVLSGERKFCIITMCVFSSTVDKSGNTYTVVRNLEREENFYSYNRPVNKSTINATTTLYQNFEFETEIIGQEEFDSTTVDIKEFKPVEKEGWFTTFRWRIYDSLEDALENTNITNFPSQFLTNPPVANLNKTEIINGGHLDTAIQNLRVDKRLTLKNRALDESTTFDVSGMSFELYETGGNGFTNPALNYKTWGLMGPLAQFYFQEIEDIKQDNIFGGEPRNSWRLLGNLFQNFGEIQLFNIDIYQILNPNNFTTQLDTDTKLFFGEVSHINMATGSSKSMTFYYKPGTDIENEYGHLTNDEMLIIKKWRRNPNNTVAGIGGPLWGETHMPSSAFTSEISGGKQIISELDPYLLKLDDQNYMYKDDVFIPIWMIHPNVGAQQRVSGHPKGHDNHTIHITDSSNLTFTADYFDVYGQFISTQNATSEVTATYKRQDDGTPKTFYVKKLNSTEDAYSVIGTSTQNFATAIWILSYQPLVPRLLSQYNSWQRWINEFNNNRKLKQLPLKTPLLDYINNTSEISFLIDAAKSDLAIAYQNVIDFGDPVPSTPPNYFDLLEEQIDEVLESLGKEYIIRGEPHTFTGIGNSSSIQNFRPNSDDISNRTRMYCNPENYSQASNQQYLFIEDLIYDQIIIPMVNDDIWDYSGDENLGMTEEIIDSNVSSFSKVYSYPIGTLSPLLPDRSLIYEDFNPTNNFGRYTPQVYTSFNMGTTYDVFWDRPFFNPYFIENDEVEEFEFYIKANLLQDIEGTRHCERKSCEVESVLKYPDLTQEQMDEMTPEEIQEYNDELPDKRNKYIAECQKIREVISKQQENLI